jgi:uncharacterized membrane protein YcaP (DUF421 family)
MAATEDGALFPMTEAFTPFDLNRMIFGDGDRANLLFLLEIAARTIVMYFYTIVLARMVGQGSIGQIGPFEFVLVIAVGSAAGDPMFYPDVPLLHGLAVITVIILLHRATQYVLVRHPRVEHFMEGEPLLVVEAGTVVEDCFGSGKLTRPELMSMLRTAGVRNVGEVERAYFEPSGKLSVFEYPASEPAFGESTMPEGAPTRG